MLRRGVGWPRAVNSLSPAHRQEPRIGGWSPQFLTTPYLEA